MTAHFGLGTGLVKIPLTHKYMTAHFLAWYRPGNDTPNTRIHDGSLPGWYRLGSDPSNTQIHDGQLPGFVTIPLAHKYMTAHFLAWYRLGNDTPNTQIHDGSLPGLVQAW